MQKTSSGYVDSPSDLIAFLENEAVTWLDRYDWEFPGQIHRDEPSEEDRLFQSVGETYEAGILDDLKAKQDVAVIERSNEGLRHTAAAMRKGRSVIYQARLENGEFAGWADFLFRVEGASELGNWHYEIWDTKLARSMKPYFAVQLCCYADMLEAVQGRRPEHVGIILGNDERKKLRTDDYWFYYRAIKRSFLEQQNSFQANRPPLFPGLADYRHWNGHVTKLLEGRNDVSLVANIRQAQIEKLETAQIRTVGDLAGSTLDTVTRMAQPTFQRLRSQARVQMQSIAGAPPAYEVLPADPDSPRLGFGLLPPHSSSDVCFDIEGYPLIEGGLEYLLGVTYEEDGHLVFKDWWAHDRTEEQASFESFIDWVYARWKHHPSMHIYHYASYETTALKRLMSRYASRESEIDDMLRNQVFVDLYTVVKQSLLIGEPSYSLKSVEHLYSFSRNGGVPTAGDSIVRYHGWAGRRDGDDWQSSPTLNLIRKYNEADCQSTWRLSDWLRDVQAANNHVYAAPAPVRELAEDTLVRSDLARRMLSAIPPDRSLEPERWRVHELLAYLVEYHRREDKSRWWQLYERAGMSEQELIDDQESLGGVRRTRAAPVPVKRSCLYEYCFPLQESKLRDGKNCRLATDIKRRVEIHKIDYDQQILTIKIGNDSVALPARFSLIPDEIVPAKAIVESIERTAGIYATTGQLPPALEDFLYRRRPRIEGAENGPLIPESQDVLAGATEVVLRMENTTLCIQGPPGSGKTSKAGIVIAELLRAGKRVGITSNSHEAICGLMKAAAHAADARSIAFTGAKCGEEDREQFHPSIQILEKNRDLFKDDFPDLVSGTAWVFSCPEASDQFDYLFIDEAGQVSIANLAGMAPAAKNLVLLGDQMQLSQPMQGVHPGESGTSILDYYLQDHATIPDDLGIFLPTTYRMRPEICGFISNAFYEGRLKHEECTLDRSIRFERQPRHLQRSAGIAFIPVEHAGNIYESEEEVQVVREVIQDLLGQRFEEHGKIVRPISETDILVVAPFNLQVRKLKGALPQIRVGTVDKFQGQQAPVVIFSMTSSEGDASPRGIEFLFDRNRLNVAISRAQVLAVILASPNLEITRCSRLEQMQLINVFCRAAQAGTSRRAFGSE